VDYGLLLEEVRVVGHHCFACLGSTACSQGGASLSSRHSPLEGAPDGSILEAEQVLQELRDYHIFY